MKSSNVKLEKQNSLESASNSGSYSSDESISHKDGPVAPEKAPYSELEQPEQDINGRHIQDEVCVCVKLIFPYNPIYLKLLTIVP